VGFSFLRVLQVKKGADERTRTAFVLITRLLPYMRACPDTSSNLAYLCGYCPLWQRLLSATFCFVPARLR
jgi:hypothetical protein